MISEHGIAEFKLRYCNENHILGQLLRANVADWVEEPILDVGAGLGDVSAVAFPDKRVIQLDRLDFSRFPIPPIHRRVKCDFFAYKIEETDPPRTLLLSHVLQFLDDDKQLLSAKVKSFSAQKIVIATNINDGFMGKILDWSSKHIPSINPEVDIAAFPPEYRFVKSWQFEGVLSCPDFECLARQLWSVILDSTLNLEEHRCAVEFLKDQLPKPEISIRQQLRTYIR